MSQPGEDGGLRFAHLTVPLTRAWKRIAVVTIAAAAVTAAVSLLTPRRFEATLTLSTVTTARGAGLPQGLQATFLAGLTTGLQPTPVFMSKLLSARVVLDAVAQRPLTAGDTLSGARRVKPSLSSASPDYQLARAISDMIGVTLDRESGLVTVSAMHQDSSIARAVAVRLVEEVVVAFRAAARTQAHQLRVAQESRVDSVVRQLQHAEEDLARFAAANRVVTPYSRVAVEGERLQRAVTLAQALYTQIMLDREAAIGRELEETPAVVTVDPLPRQLVPMPRNTLWKTLLAALVAAFAMTAWVVARDRSGGDADAQRSGAAGTHRD